MFNPTFLQPEDISLLLDPMRSFFLSFPRFLSSYFRSFPAGSRTQVEPGLDLILPGGVLLLSEAETGETLRRPLLLFLLPLLLLARNRSFSGGIRKIKTKGVTFLLQLICRDFRLGLDLPRAQPVLGDGGKRSDASRES